MNIVLVSLDGVRPDFLTSDFFKKIKEEGLEYTNCIVQASHTSTSHTSILTGLYPFNHGVRWLVEYEVKAKMLQEVLKQNNFATAAFIGGFPLVKGNLDRGFDLFEYKEVIDDTKEGREKFCPANVVVQDAIKWLTDSPDKDNFAFLHFFDAHLMLRSEFANNPWPAKDENGIFIDIDKYLGRRKIRYQEEVNFIGSQLELLFNLTDIDLLIITADHGTKMQGEKNYPWVYNSKRQKVGTQFHVAELYEQQLKVPLLIWHKRANKEKITEQVRSIDIMPTILDFLGIDYPAVDGLSLLKRKYPEYAYSETYFAQLVEANKRAYELHSKFSWGWQDIDSLVSIRSNEHKLICTANARIVPYGFYDIRNDPAENNNLLKTAQSQEERKRLERYLLELIKDDKQIDIQSNLLEEGVRSRLENLGYL